MKTIFNSIDHHLSTIERMEYEQQKMYFSYIHEDLLSRGNNEYFYYSGSIHNDGDYPIYTINPKTKGREKLGSLNCLGILINMMLLEIEEIRDIMGEIDDINAHYENIPPLKDWNEYVYDCFSREFTSQKTPKEYNENTTFDGDNFIVKKTKNKNYDIHTEAILLDINKKLNELKALNLDFNKGAELIRKYPIKIVAQKLYNDSKNKNPNIQF